MTSQPSLPADAGRMQRILRYVSATSLGALLLWAGFWLWFSISDVISEPTLAWQPYTFIGSLVALSLIAWKVPKVGGVLLVAAGLFAGYYFNNIWARGMLALPAMIIGAARVAAACRPASTLPRNAEQADR